MKLGFVYKILLLITTLILLSYIIFRTYHAEESQRTSDENESITKIDPIVFAKQANETRGILLWNSFFNDVPWILPAATLDPKSFRDLLKCPVSNCEIKNSSLLPDHEFDAIVFHAVNDLQNKLPFVRNASQFYIFASLESPPYTWQKLHHMQNFYNLTMTFRLDSDILWSHRQIVDVATSAVIAPSMNPKWRKPPKKWQHPEITKTFLRKARSVVWSSSHCQTISQREYIVQELREYIDVDIYGRCGTKNCHKNDHNCQFDKLLRTNYKFYLAFESTLCKDYVSLAAYEALENSIIPVVFGGANYTRFLPPLSYINAEDFDDIRTLATYLRMVGNYAEEYSRYFWWRAYYRVANVSVFCNLCEFLHNQHNGEKVQVYNDIKAWWRTAGDCRYQSKLKIIQNNEKKLENLMSP